MIRVCLFVVALVAALAPIWLAPPPVPAAAPITWVSGEVCTDCPVKRVKTIPIQIRSVRVVGPEFTPPYVLVLPSVP